MPSDEKKLFIISERNTTKKNTRSRVYNIIIIRWRPV